MTPQEEKLFDSLLVYWQLVVDELEKNLYIANKVRSGETVQSIGEFNQKPITMTSSGFRVQISMPSHYQYLDEGVSGAKYNKGISRFKYTTKLPPVSKIRDWMDLVPTRWVPKNTTSGKRRDQESMMKGIAFAIARKIFNEGLERTDFYSKAINDQKILDFEKQLLEQYGSYVLSVVKLDE